jgi:hypothetical protein
MHGLVAWNEHILPQDPGPHCPRIYLEHLGL